MNLKHRLDQDLKSAMKEKNKDKLNVIRMVKASIKKKEIDNRKELADEDVLEVLNKEVKQRRDSIEQFKLADRIDLAEKEQKEIEFITSYLPQQLSEQELKNIISSTIKESNHKDFGKIMSALMPKIKGKADGKIVSQLVKEML